MPPEGIVVKAKPVREAKAAVTPAFMGEHRSLFATVAYHFPQYTLKDVAQLPYRDILLLLYTAQKIEAERMYNLTLIASAPHSKKGKGVKDLIEYFRKIINRYG